MKVLMKIFLWLVVPACGLRLSQGGGNLSPMISTMGRGSNAQSMQCSVDDFQKTKAYLIKSGLLQYSYNADALYNEIQTTCQADKPMPVISNKTLIVNLGQGTTGTRWLARVMASLGFHSAHNCIKVGPNAYASDEFEYISDAPVPYQATHIIQGYPNAVFLFSLRDAEEWRVSRLEHHNGPHPAFDICGRKVSPPLARAESATYETVRQIWLSCILPEEKIFKFNLFTTDDDTFLLQLKSFLEKHGLQKEMWEEKFQQLREMRSSAMLRDFDPHGNCP
eukprot:gnl/MRDRNA2_/MRDRNA2_115216_c0_seq1.p1 gnl/MRDRNA2_/MRDRNA2_115216_c0~~gnl/MRDRNA2_/MRDRNA2_115216_c0_seq1.p1  ORF type:complete len:279 (-),score=29.55 gnl/MRDRNA2_/MRDRNA2_115216_c0_seq1:51-887(-)